MGRDGEVLADRVRAALPNGRPVREVRMFGGLSFMVDDSMVVAARGSGDLLVRMLPSRREELLQVSGAAPAEMGSGRSMGPGWIIVREDGLIDDEALAFWIGVGLETQASRGKSSRGTAG